MARDLKDADVHRRSSSEGEKPPCSRESWIQGVVHASESASSMGDFEPIPNDGARQARQ